MKSRSLLLTCGLILSSIFLFPSCEKEKGGDDEGGKEEIISPSSVTVGSERVTAFGAILKGQSDLGKPAEKPTEMGIIWSTEKDFVSKNSTKVKATEIDRDNNFNIEVSSLDPGTKYYFRSYLTIKGTDIHGDIKEFTTKEMSSIFSTLDADEVTATSAVMNALLDLSDIRYDNLEYGFYWGTSAETQDVFLKGRGLSSGKYSAVMNNLPHLTQYWYKAYLKLDSRTFYGEVKTFTTGKISVESVSLDKSEYTFHNLGETLTLNAVVSPSNATDKGIEWSSDNEAVASVDNGKVTGLSNGTAVITVTTDDGAKSASCVVTVSQYVTSISLDKTSMSLEAGQTGTITATVGPDSAQDKSIIWSSSDESVATVDAEGVVSALSEGTAFINATAKDGSGVAAQCKVSVYRFVVPEVVDLGLSVKWASFNLGASSPVKSGMFFAWGEVSSKEQYDWLTYKWCYGNYSTLTKYNTRAPSGIVDGKTVLDSEDDAATSKLGGKFRTPTKEEFSELVNQENCTWAWTEMEGVKGYKVTSKIEGYAGNWIFLPATGYFDGSSIVREGASGYYWSSSVNPEQSRYAYRLEIGSSDYYWYNSDRCVGLQIRPVVDR